MASPDTTFPPTSSASTSTSITLRPPTTSTHLPQPPTFTPPSPSFLTGTWHVTHSTLPMWKSKRNVSITYTPLAPSSTSATAQPSEANPLPHLDDLVQYQTLSSDKLKTVEGIDTPSKGSRGGEWDWRGKGWLRIAGSHWEVLGYGEIPGEGEGEENAWAVTYFAKTLFTPAGVDVYSRRKEGLGEDIIDKVKGELAKCEDEAIKKLAVDLFEVTRN